MKYLNYNVKAVRSNYSENNALAVALLDEDDKSINSIITVNIEDSDFCDDNCAFIDTNNNGDEIVRWLEKNELATLTGVFGTSGFCIYPEMKFDLTKLEELKR